MIIVLGVLANLFFVVGGFFREPKTSMICAIFGNMTYTAYYFLLELHSPIFSVLISTLAFVMIVKVQCKRTIRLVAGLSAGLISVLILMNLSSGFDFLLIAAAIAIACSQINKDNYIFYKSFVLISQALWITFCLNFSDYAMLCTCLFISATNIYSLIFNLKKDGASFSFLPLSSIQRKNFPVAIFKPAMK